MNRFVGSFIVLLALIALLGESSNAAARKPLPQASVSPAVVSLSVIPAESAARYVRALYPRVRIIIDHAANALLITASPDDLAAIRQIVSGIDTKSALTPIAQSIHLHRVDASAAATQLRRLYPQARFAAISHRDLIVTADNADLQQIQTLLSTIDAPQSTPTPTSSAMPAAVEAVTLYQAQPRQVAREVSGAVRGIRVQVAGRSIVLTGAPDLVQHAKDLIAVLDTPPPGTRYTAVYRIRTLDAQSVADLLQRSFPDVKIVVDEDVNSLSVFATAAEQRRIADGIAQLDASQTTPQNGAPTTNGAATAITDTPQLYTLRYALPGQGGAPSTSATDLAAMLTQTLSSQAPDLHVAVVPDGTQLLLTGNPYSIKLAKEMLAALDVPKKEIVLDTEILEVDENTAKNLGLQLSNIAGGSFSIGTLFQEIPPSPNPVTGVTPPLGRLQRFGRTSLGFIAVLNLAIQHGTARVLADPRITTLSGHTATIRAGDNISIQLQAGGGVGTIATTQIQTFQTGVSLDITPIVNASGLITVALHPVVNSLTGILNGIPQISTRDTQTTVALEENQTLVIGGLIQDNTQRTESKIPVLGDLPLVGGLFRNETLNGDRNELIITVTPHIVTPGEAVVYPGPPLPAAPTPQPLPTVVPGAIFPGASPTPASSPSVAKTADRAPPSPLPSATAKQDDASPTPSPTPPPLHPEDAFTFKAPPSAQSNTAGAHIYYAQFAPAHLAYGSPFSLVALTSANTAALSISYNGVSLSIPQSGPGRWQATLPFTLMGTPARAGKVLLSLQASSTDGSHDTVTIPVDVLAQ